MIGNVWEWVADCDYEYLAEPRDGVAVTEGSEALSKNCAVRVVRGGSWYDGARFLRAPARGRDSPSLRGDYLGFRLARSD